MERKYIESFELRKALKAAAQYLELNKEKINALNVFPVPDGDTGTNMSLTMKSAVKKSTAEDLDTVGDIAMAASQGSLMGARGNSGVILSQLFRGFALGLKDREKADINSLARSFREAADTAYKAVMKPTEGTILTVAREMGEYAEKIVNKESDIIEFLEKVIEHGNKTLARTEEMLLVLKEAGVVDAGGKGLMTILIGGYNSLIGLENPVEDDLEEQEEKYQELVEHRHLDTENIKYSYCTEFMIQGDASDLDIERLRNFLSGQGDSLMVVNGEGLVKVHVHTNNPGRALEKALEIGILNDIKIDNMKLQYEKVKERRREKPSKKYAFVAVSTGAGIGEIFKDMNVDRLVEGGQTMNPSTEDIVKAIEETNGENVFVLPNNGNIILAAEQSKELTDRNVIVIPTKTIPQGITSMFNFDESASVEENEENLREAIGEVKTGQLTYAVRDSEIKGNKIEEGDLIGLLEGDIIVNGKDREKVLEELMDSMVDEDSSLITLLYGEDVEDDKAREIEERLEELYSDMDIEVLYGGQPIYYYIISVE